MPYKLTFEDGSDGYLAQTELDPKEVERRRYAFPEERKFPLTDASKVMSAIKFFNYVDPKDERHLAEAILKRMEELGISEVNVGPTNRFKKYYEAQDGYLKHFGVKGMHWGVWNDETRARRMGSSVKRRYVNDDGSLTDAGKKRYLQGHADVAYKDLKKQVRKQRKEQHGSGNQWMTNTPIGEHSKKYLDAMNEKEKAYRASKEYKDWEKKIDFWQKEAEKRFEVDDSPDFWEKYDKAYFDLMAKKPKKNFSSPYDAGVTIRGFGAKGRQYTEGYLQGAGKDLSIAYLKDLGYNQKTAEQLVNRMMKKNRTLGFV